MDLAGGCEIHLASIHTENPRAILKVHVLLDLPKEQQHSWQHSMQRIDKVLEELENKPQMFRKFLLLLKTKLDFMKVSGEKSIRNINSN